MNPNFPPFFPTPLFTQNPTTTFPRELCIKTQKPASNMSSSIHGPQTLQLFNNTIELLRPLQRNNPLVDIRDLGLPDRVAISRILKRACVRRQSREAVAVVVVVVGGCAEGRAGRWKAKGKTGRGRA